MVVVVMKFGMKMAYGVHLLAELLQPLSPSSQAVFLGIAKTNMRMTNDMHTREFNEYEDMANVSG